MTKEIDQVKKEIRKNTSQKERKSKTLKRKKMNVFSLHVCALLCIFATRMCITLKEACVFFARFSLFYIKYLFLR